MTGLPSPPGGLLASGRPPDLPSHLVDTESIRLTRAALRLTLGARSMMLLHGPPGLGKTTTTAVCAQECQELGVPTRYLAIPEDPSPNEVLVGLIEVLTGSSPEGSKHELENEVRAILADFGGLIIVDEVQNLKRRGLQELRYLHDDGTTTVSMLLSGWGAEKLIGDNPDLNSRIPRQIQFVSMQRSEVPDVVGQLSHVLAASDHQHLLRINDNFAHGIFRNWAAVVSTVEQLGISRLDSAAVDIVLGLHGPRAHKAQS